MNYYWRFNWIFKIVTNFRNFRESISIANSIAIIYGSTDNNWLCFNAILIRNQFQCNGCIWLSSGWKSICHFQFGCEFYFVYTLHRQNCWVTWMQINTKKAESVVASSYSQFWSVAVMWLMLESQWNKHYLDVFMLRCKCKTVQTLPMSSCFFFSYWLDNGFRNEFSIAF